jgi:hypothetical protein
MEFTIYQMISFLNQIQNKDRTFKRKNDDKFIVFRGNMGDLMYELNQFIKPLPIFNYTQDKWILIEE